MRLNTQFYEQRVALNNLLRRWFDKSRVDQEFWGFQPVDHGRRFDPILNETLVSDTVSFMREWLEYQKSDSKTARAHQD